jgi:hypothetical protein
MIEAFKEIPAPLRKQALIRLGIGMGFIIVSTIILITARDLYTLLPCAGAAMFFLASAFLLFRRAALGEYVVVTGICAEAGKPITKRRAKHIVIETEACKLRVAVGNRHGRIRDGTGVTLYISSNTPVYDRGGMIAVCSYLAIEFSETGGGKHV